MIRCVTTGLVLAVLLAACPRPPEKEQRRLPAVVVVDPDDGEGAQLEQEPNDERKQAQKVEPGQQIKAGISSTKDQDWYVAEAMGDGILRAWLRGGGGADFVLEAFDGAGKRLVRVDSEGSGGTEVLPNLAVARGKVFFRVGLKDAKDALKGAPQTYDFRYELRSAESGEEREPNWKKELASPLTIGDDAVGFLGWKTDSDWYRIDMSSAPAGMIRAEVEGVDGVWPVVELRDSQGKLIQRRRGRAGATVVLARIPRPADSELYLVVRTLRTFNVEARYSVRVFVEPAVPGEQEPNDRAAQASWVAENVQVSGVLADHYDRDFFALRVAKKSLVWVELSPSFRLDPSVAVVDAKGEVLMEINAGGAGERETIPALLAHPPQLTLRLRVPSPDGADVAGRYRLRLRTRDLVGFEQEPNNKATLATPLLPAPDGSISAFSHPEGDVDFYYLVGRGEKLEVKVTTAPALELEVTLQQEGGKPLVSRRGRGELVLDAQALSGQRYLLKVQAVKGGDARRPYRLKVSRGPAPLAVPPSAADKESL